MSPKPFPLNLINLKADFSLSAVFLNQLQRAAKQILGEEGCLGTVNLVLVDKKKMRQLNRRFRKIDRVTDVLSFAEEGGDVGGSAGWAGSNQDRLTGEIVLCVDQAQRQARDFEIDQREEISRLVIHGLLHLLGYNHVKRAERLQMRAKEEFYAAKICQKF